MPLELFVSEAPVSSCACGTEHFAIASAEGHVYTWGRRHNGRLGLPEGNVAALGGGPRASKVEVPTRVGAMSGFHVTQVACGNTQTVCLTERGQVISWRKDNSKLDCLEPLDPAETGAPYPGALPWRPYLLRMPVKVATVCCGWEFTIALTESATMLGWGENDKGQLGFQTSGPVRRPTAIDLEGAREVDEEFEVASVACGSNHASCIDSDGRLFTWGDNEFGQCGQGHWDPIATPRQVGGAIVGLKVHRVAAGQHTVAIVGPKKSLYSWGAGTRGQLGHGTEIDRNSPKQIASLGNLKFDQVYCGEYHSLAVTTESLVYTWDSNIFGELTQGTKGSLKKVACYTEPQYRGKNLQEEGPAASVSGRTADAGGPSPESKVRFECGGVGTLVVRYKERRVGGMGRGAVGGTPNIARMRDGRGHGSPGFGPPGAQQRSGMRAGSNGREKSPFKVSPETAFFPVPPKEECKSTLALREMKKRRHRKALEMYRKAMSDVAKKANPFSSIEEEDRIISSFFAGSSLETIFNDIVLTPHEAGAMAGDRDNVALTSSVEKAASHVKNASMSIAQAALALDTSNPLPGGVEDSDGAGPLSQLEKREILQISSEIKKHIERYHGKTVELPVTPRKGEDMDTYYEEVAYQAHSAARRILHQMHGMRMMYEDLAQAVGHLNSDQPDDALIDYLMTNVVSRQSSLQYN